MFWRKKRNENVERAECLNRRIARGAALSDDELDAVVSTPSLYQGVRARIAAERGRRAAAAERITLTTQLAGIVSDTRNWWRLGAATAAVAVLALLVFTLPQRSRIEPVAPSLQTRNAGQQVTPVPASPLPPTPQAKPENAVAQARPERIRQALPRIRATRAQAEPEDATGFLPIKPLGAAQVLDESQIVRVKIPRSSLLAFGLPMDSERANEPISVDVALGDDGTPLAVRFIR